MSSKSHSKRKPPVHRSGTCLRTGRPAPCRAPSPTSHAQPGLPTSTASRPSQFPRRIPQHKAAPPRPLLSAATPRGAPTCPLSGLPRRRRRSRPSQKPDPDPCEVRWDPACLLPPPPPSTARSAHLTTPLDHLRSPRPALHTAAAAVVVLELKPPSFARLRVVPLPDLGCFWSIALVFEWLP
jgi:hypothetical protein